MADWLCSFTIMGSFLIGGGIGVAVGIVATLSVCTPLWDELVRRRK